MTRCKEFYDKVEREGFEWCEKDSATKSNINFYLKVVNELTEHGIEKKFTYVNFSENASRPLHKITDSKIRDEVVSLIADALNRGEKPSAADLKVWIDLASGIDPVKEKLTYGNKESPKTSEPEKETIAPSPVIAAGAVAAIAHVPEENIIPIIEVKEKTLVLKSPQNVSQIPPVVPELVTIVPTRGQWRSIDNAIRTGVITADVKAGKDAWQVGAMRVFEMGCNALEAGGKV